MTVGGGAGLLSLQAFLERFFSGLSGRGIAYRVLGNYAKIPLDNGGTGIDALVATERLEESVRLLCNVPGVTVTSRVRQGNCVNAFIAGVGWSGRDAIQVERIHKLDRKGVPYPQAGEVLKRAHGVEGLAGLCLDHLEANRTRDVGLAGRRYGALIGRNDQRNET